MGAGKGWSQHENLLACKAFVTASQNSKKGNGQKTHKFEKQIENEFISLVEDLKQSDNEFQPSCMRSGSSISQRFKAIRKACLIYHGTVEQINNSKPTGCPSDHDIRTAATALYNGIATIKDVYRYFAKEDLKVGKPFLYMNCYLWLLDTYLWKMIVHATAEGSPKSNKKDPERNEQTKTSSQEDNSSTKNSSAIEKRPTGSRKAATHIKQVQVLEKGASGIEVLANESKKRNDIAAKLLEVEQRNSRMSLFQMEGTPLSVRTKFLEYEQKRVLKEMECEANEGYPEAKKPKRLEEICSTEEHKNKDQELKRSKGLEEEVVECGAATSGKDTVL